MNPWEFLQKWYIAQCNGEWEQIKGVTIETLHTPGWLVTIDIADTPLEGVYMEPVRIDNSASDWIECQIENAQFIGKADASKLPVILQVFKKWASSNAREK